MPKKCITNALFTIKMLIEKYEEGQNSRNVERKFEKWKSALKT